MIKVITDSVGSIPRDIAEKLGLQVLSLFVHRDGVEYVDAEMDLDAFYADMRDMVNDIPTSSQPSQAEFEQAFEEAAEAGDEVLGVFMSTRMSGTYDGALRAIRSVAARHADFKYALVDSLSAGTDAGMPAVSAVLARNEGASLQQCTRAALDSVASCRYLFAPENLTFLKAGGRIGGAAALLGNLIQLIPILTVIDGQPEVKAKVRSYKKAQAKMVEIFKADVEAHGLRSLVVNYIGDTKEKATQWARECIEPLANMPVLVIPVSPVVGLHVGPAMGITYECKEKITGKLVNMEPTLITSANY